MSKMSKRIWIPRVANFRRKRYDSIGETSRGTPAAALRVLRTDQSEKGQDAALSMIARAHDEGRVFDGMTMISDQKIKDTMPMTASGEMAPLGLAAFTATCSV
jgi:hypothetical protein